MPEGACKAVQSTPKACSRHGLTRFRQPFLAQKPEQLLVIFMVAEPSRSRVANPLRYHSGTGPNIPFRATCCPVCR